MERLAVRRARAMQAMQRDDTPLAVAIDAGFCRLGAAVRVIDSRSSGEPMRLAVEGRLDRGAGLFARFRAKRDRLPAAAVNEPRSWGARAGRGQPQARIVSGQPPSRSSAR